MKKQSIDVDISRRSFFKKVSKALKVTAKTTIALGITARLGVWRTYDESTLLSELGSGYDGNVLKVMSWNVAGWRRRSLPAEEAIGFQQREIKETFEQACEFIRSENPTILMTQEDTSGNIGSNFFNSFGLLQRIFGHAYYGKLFNYGYFGGLMNGGDYGNAIYSRSSLECAQMFSFADEFSFFEHPFTKLEDLFAGSKGIVSARFLWKGRPVYLDNFHLSSGNVDSEREQQLDLYLRNIFDQSTTRIIAGDFNSPANSKQRHIYDDGEDHTNDRSIEYLMQQLEELGPHRHVFWQDIFTNSTLYNTFPSTDTETLEPRECNRTYDMICGFAPNRNLEMISYHVAQDIHLSDHAPVIAEFVLRL